MLNKFIIEKAMVAAESLNRSKRHMLPISGSVVGELVDITTMDHLFFHKNDPSLTHKPLLNVTTESIAESISISTNIPVVEETAAHSVVMNGFVQSNKVELIKVIKLAKFIYYPMAETIEDIVIAKLEEASKLVVGYDIEQIKLNPLMLDSSICELTTPYRFSKPMIIDAKSVIELEADKIKDLAYTGNPGFNSELDKIGSSGWANISSLYNGTKKFDDLTDLESIAAFLTSKAIVDDYSHGKLTASPDDYRLRLTSIIEQSGLKIYNTIMKNRQDAERNNLFMGKSYTKNDVTIIPVRDDIYKRLLNDGLTPEALIGNEVVTHENNTGMRRFVNGNDIIKYKDALTKNYSMSKDIIDANKRDRLDAITKSIIMETIATYIKNEAANKLALSKDEHFTKLKVFYNYKFNHLDIYTAIKDIILAVFFDWCDLKRFICTVDDTAKYVTEGTSKEEIVTIATMRYLCKWVAKQIACVER